MRCTRVAIYDITSGTFDQILSKAQAGMVPLYQGSPGFVSYGVAQVDQASFVSVSTWETRAQGDAATVTAADWVKANGDQQFALREMYLGDLAIDAHEPLPVS